MVVRTVEPLKQELTSLKAAQEYIAKLRKGASKHKDSKMEIHYNPKKVKNGRWNVVVIDEEVPPGARPCAECEKPFFGEYTDYLCPECRESAYT